MFGNLRKVVGNVQKKGQKRRHWYVYNKQNIAHPLVDTNFIFSCSTRDLTSESSELVTYRVEHSEIKFISTRGHVISSMYSTDSILHNSETYPDQSNGESTLPLLAKFVGSSLLALLCSSGVLWFAFRYRSKSR